MYFYYDLSVLYITFSPFQYSLDVLCHQSKIVQVNPEQFDGITEGGDRGKIRIKKRP